MASFIGTPQEFRRYIGPRLRNLVNQISRNHKKEISECEHCGSSERLEAAHIKGRGRKKLIDLVLEKFTNADIVTIDLEIFEEKFIAEHEPIQKTILILCRDCHVKYDSLPDNSPKLDNESASVKSVDSDDKDNAKAKFTLPIKLEPQNPMKFKQELLKTKRAEIETVYLDGSSDKKPWKANNFSEKSNVLGNLRSRPEFRNGAWQELKIKEVIVRVINFSN